MRHVLLLLLLLTPYTGAAQDNGAPTWDEDAFSDDSWDSEWNGDDGGLAWSGFAELGLGTRLSEDALLPERNTLEDARLRVETTALPGNTEVSLKADLGYDGIDDDWIVGLRELSLAFSPGDSTDVLIGRSVQTWGTGDLVFLNDLFPKDFVSFFSGRDDEYLKAPGNALRITHFTERLNIDFVWSPVFEHDVYIDGGRYSFFSPLAAGNVAPQPPLRAVEPSEGLADGEFALRLFKTIEGTELAAYFYRGYFKQPTALTNALVPTFAPMNAYGMSVRTGAGPGLLNAEFSLYDSRDDEGGSDPLVPNSQIRLLLGYEWEAKPNFTVGLQYYQEWTLDHEQLVRRSPFPEFEPDERRHLLTNRLTWRTGLNRYTWSLFTFYSPSDGDAYLRPRFNYRHSDQWSLETGANLFAGSDQHTFFKQLEDASNLFLRVRFNY